MINPIVEYVHSLQWQKEDFSAILCVVKFKHFKRELPYSASINDCEEIGRNIYLRCISGEFGEILPYKEQVPTQISLTENVVNKEQKLENTSFEEIQKLLNVVNAENGKKSFRSVVIVWGSYIEQQLKQLLLKKCESLENKINCNVNFEKKIDLAFKLGIITDTEKVRCNLIRKIRNILAHEPMIEENTEIFPLLKKMYDLDHSDLFEYIEDIDFLLQMICAGSCGKQAFQLDI